MPVTLLRESISAVFTAGYANIVNPLFQWCRKPADSTSCVEIPGQDAVPAQLRVRTYPALERHSALWVWMGDPALADPERLSIYNYAHLPTLFKPVEIDQDREDVVGEAMHGRLEVESREGLGTRFIVRLPAM